MSEIAYAIYRKLRAALVKLGMGLGLGGASGAVSLAMSGGTVPEDHNTVDAVATFTLSGASSAGWALDDDGPQNNLVIDISTGVLTRTAAANFDFETFPNLNIVVRNGTISSAFTIAITDVAEGAASDIAPLLVAMGAI